MGIPIGAFGDVSILNKKTVVCISAGSAIVTSDWENNAAAILHVFYPGVEGGSVLARLLSGELSPSGKLPFSIPITKMIYPFLILLIQLFITIIFMVIGFMRTIRLLPF